MPKSTKLNFRAYLGHLVGYNSNNIFKIWVPNKNLVIRTRDVTFNDKKFYNPTDLDLGSILQLSAEKFNKNTWYIIEMKNKLIVVKIKFIAS